jgi:hypothetical protein
MRQPISRPPCLRAPRGSSLVRSSMRENAGYVNSGDTLENLVTLCGLCHSRLEGEIVRGD